MIYLNTIKNIFLIIFLREYVNCLPQNYRVSELDTSGLYTKIRAELYPTFGQNSENPKNLRLARAMGKLQERVSDDVKFPCNISIGRSPVPPSNVNELRPGDIDIVAGIGDSLTAAYGLLATSITQVLIENRGLSWSIGGQGTWREYLTLPNILKEFNPNLFGYSLRDSYTTQRDSQFNVAEGAALSWETVYMTSVLIRRLKSDRRVDINNHWKLVTFMIGANDFCLDICFHDNIYNVLENHRRDLLAVLRILKSNLPRTIVNLVPPPSISILDHFTNRPLQCETMNRVECYCLFASKYKKYRREYFSINTLWQQLEEDIANMDEFQQNDFAVVFQPFSINFEVPLTKNNETDYTFLSEDCFHLSQKMNARAANALWNNMLEPVGKKSNYMTSLFEKFLCPTEENPYIFTNGNSK